jgi:ribokinase
MPGGKGANQAVAARRLGAPTALVGAVGADGFGAVLAGFLGAERIDTSLVRTEHGPSGTALITVADGGENTVIVVAGANESVDPARVGEAAIRPGDVVLLQDEIPGETNEAAARAARAAGARTVLNVAPFRRPSPALLAAADVLILNETEFAELAGLPGGGADQIAARLRAGLAAPDGQPVGDVVVTLGSAGALARIDGEVIALPGQQVPVVDTTGAGDCFCGAFGASLAAGLSAPEALERANVAAGLAVGRFGASPAMPTEAELDAALRAQVSGYSE